MYRLVYGFVVYVILALFCGCSPNELNADSPIKKFFPKSSSELNILVVTFDALRADVLGVYGNPKNTSPFIDQFSNDALVFEEAYTTAATTPTSFAATFTGKYPFRSFIGGVMKEGPTMASILNDIGYATGFVSNNVQLVAKRRFSQGFDYYQIFETESDDDVLQQALKLFEHYRSQKFFLWFHFLSPHIPYDYRTMAAHLYEPGYTGRFAKTSGRNLENLSDKDLKRLRDLYDGEVYYADSLFKQIVEKLQQLGIFEETLIVLSADHGEQFMEHGSVKHEALYEENIQIPLIIRNPQAQSGGRTRLPYMNIDLFPTLAGVSGAKLNGSGLDGKNLLGENVLGSARKLLAIHMMDPRSLKAALRWQNEKMIVTCTEEETTYLEIDLTVDPKEQNGEKNVVLSENHLYRSMTSIMGGPPCAVLRVARNDAPNTKNMNKKQIQRLKTLGYAQ